jgi:hypothetical protein
MQRAASGYYGSAPELVNARNHSLITASICAEGDLSLIELNQSEPFLKRGLCG